VRLFKIGHIREDEFTDQDAASERQQTLTSDRGNNKEENQMARMVAQYGTASGGHLFFLVRYLFGCLVGFLGGSKRLGSMFHRLPGVFVAGLVVTLAMMDGSCSMSMRGHFVKFGGSLVRILWHGTSFRARASVRASPFYRSFEGQPATIIL
jgi:hypothetical protein